MSKKDEYQSKFDELKNKSLSELGDIENTFGKKYKGFKIKEIYKQNPDYIRWVKTIEDKNYVGNDYYFSLEYSKRAMVLYMDLIELMTNAGK